MAGEAAHEFQELLEGVRYQHTPMTPYEHALVGRVASLTWRLSRVVAAENALYEKLLLREVAEDRAVGPDELWAMAFDTGGHESPLNRLARYEASLQRDLDRTERLLQTIKLEAPWPMREERREHGRPIPPPPKVMGTQPPSLAPLASPPAERGEIKRGAPRPDSLSEGTAKRGEPNRTKSESTKPPSLAARAAPPNAKRWGEIQRGELSPEQLAKVEAWPPERLAEAMAARLRAAQPSPPQPSPDAPQPSPDTLRVSPSPALRERERERSERGEGKGGRYGPVQDQADINTDVFDRQD